MLETVLLALGWVGTGLATLFAATLLSRREPGETWLGTGFAVAALASGLVMTSHSGFASSGLEAAEVAATLAAGPLVAHWAAHAVVVRVSPWISILAFLPAAFWAGAGLAGAGFAGSRDAIRWAVVVQIGWSVAAAVLVGLRRRALGVETRRLLVAGLAGLGVLHLTQLARLLAPGTTPRNLVPATMGCLLAGLAYASLGRSRLRLSPRGTDDPDEHEAARLIARLDDWLVRERGLVERRVTVASAASRIGTTPAKLSRALNRRGGVTFVEHVARHRIAEARRLLFDPALDHLSVEAIGHRAGFGSRSVFFAEFRRHTGSSPAEFRDRRTSEDATPD